MKQELEKISAFKQAVVAETDRKIHELEHEIEVYQTEQIERVKQATYDRMFVLMQSEIQAIKAKHAHKLMRLELQNKRDLILYRNQLTENVFQLAAQVLTSFTQDPGYQPFLEEGITKCCEQLPAADMTIIVRPGDIKIAQRFAQQMSDRICGVQEDIHIKIGGFMLWSQSRGVLLDYTFDARLEQQRPIFYRDYGMTVE